MTETYTRDGETKFELVYDLPEDDDATVYLAEADADEGAVATTVTRAEFDAEFREYDYDDHMANNLPPEPTRL